MPATRFWQVALPLLPPDPALSALVGDQPIVAAALARRGFTNVDAARAFLDPAQYRPAPASDLPGMDEATRLLLTAIRAGQKILIWGDFDVDGQTASALLVEALRPLTRIRLHIPDRATDSHGIQLAPLRRLITEESPRVLLTCDTGISAHAAIDEARAHGLITIITDHHDLPATLPRADAIVNPNLLSPGHPLRGLPGVGVVYKLAEALYAGLADDPIFAARVRSPKTLIDLAALGIVADVAPLVGDTRYLLQIGLERLRLTERPGLRALFAVARVDPLRVSAETIGFQVGPRLNAAGRLGDALTAVELLTTADDGRAALLAGTLDGLNQRRRTLQRAIDADARAQIEADPGLLDFTALVLFGERWHGGVLGPAAGRLAEDYARPVLLLCANADDPSLARGSARSAAGYDISAALSAVAGLLRSFGGHPGAAGVSLEIAKIPALRRALSGALAAQPRVDLARRATTLRIDAVIPLEDADRGLAEALARLAPFGEGNPAIVLETDNLEIISAATIDRLHLHRQLILESADGLRTTAYWWNSGERPVPTTRIDLAYTLSLTPAHTVEITTVDVRPHVVPGETAPIARQLFDRRDAAEPHAMLAELRAAIPDMVVWAEGYPRAESPGLTRHELTDDRAGLPLAIFTVPPSSILLREWIARLDPLSVYLFGVIPPAQAPTEFLRQLEGIARFVIAQQAGRIDLDALCGRTAQSEAAVRVGLACLSRIAVAETPDGTLELRLANTERNSASERTRLSTLLDESRAFRAYFARAPLSTLLE